ncbi:MAG: hypothetical protein JF597_01290 [Streptomyces sp.]|nr:hypothetical protein [Streptomyces sp.]MBW8792268.1 hypothetical protein [Streptomyces sp.]
MASKGSETNVFTEFLTSGKAVKAAAALTEKIQQGKQAQQGGKGKS